MFKTFLRFDGDMYKISCLSADEMIILAKIMEFHYSTGEIFVSNETFAELSHCSISTVDRRIKHLEQLGLIKRDSKVTHNGTDRKIYFNESKYLELVNGKQEESVNDKLENADKQDEVRPISRLTNANDIQPISRLTNGDKQDEVRPISRLTNGDKHVDLIKDNIKDNIEKIRTKDNSARDAADAAPSQARLPEAPVPDVKKVKKKRAWDVDESMLYDFSGETI